MTWTTTVQIVRRVTGHLRHTGRGIYSIRFVCGQHGSTSTQAVHVHCSPDARLALVRLCGRSRIRSGRIGTMSAVPLPIPSFTRDPLLHCTNFIPDTVSSERMFVQSRVMITSRGMCFHGSSETSCVCRDYTRVTLTDYITFLPGRTKGEDLDPEEVSVWCIVSSLRGSRRISGGRNGGVGFNDSF